MLDRNKENTKSIKRIQTFIDSDIYYPKHSFPNAVFS